MPSKIIVLFLLFMNLAGASDDFKYNGFLGANVSMGGIAQVTDNGLLRLTNTSQKQVGHAFYSIPIPFKDSATRNALSFSTTFVIAIVPGFSGLGGHGMAFVISPSKDLTKTMFAQFLGLFNSSNDGNSSNHMVAIEFDTVQNPEFHDIDDNHVGIDINSLSSKNSTHSAYFTEENGGLKFKNLSLASGEPILVWVEYNGLEKQLNVTLSPLNIAKPSLPLLSFAIDLSPIILDSMYVGFSSATGLLVASHYVLGWSFKMNGQAQMLDLSSLPKLPRLGPKKRSMFFTIGVPSTVFLVFATIFVIFLLIQRKRKYAEVLDDWEHEYGPHRFSYKDLFKATKGFGDTQLLGVGGFGMVYKGVLPTSKIQVAVKRVSHKSKQGMKEFIAEIVCLGRLRHRNLVQLLGYCRRQGELLLVYDFMPNGSLDKFLFNQPERTLNWHQRFRIIKGVASGLLYLHEEWEQIVLHRDIKASNILLDGEFNGLLGDFGLARLYDHGTDPQTTHIVGTLGYIAPELTRTGKATTSTDVFAFGAFILEVTCGRRPILLSGSPEEIILVDWVLRYWDRGEIVEARDLRLGNEYVKEEVELVLKLGLLCSHPMEAARPSMRQVMQFLDGDCPLPQLSSNGWSTTIASMRDDQMFKEVDSSYPSTLERSFMESTSSFAESILSGGR